MSRAQIKCGELTAGNLNGEKRFVGPVRLIGRLSGTLELRGHPRSDRGDKAPDYEVFYKPTGSDEVYPLGAAWLKNSDRAGGDFLSLTLIHPDWADDLSLAAYPTDIANNFSIVYSRPRQFAAAA